jgi:hypothetical protein
MVVDGGGGLAPPREQRGEVSATETTDRLHTMTADAGTTEYSATGSNSGQSVESHLDSFIEQSGWTRQDLVTVATLLNSVLFLALLYLEVKRA